MVMPGSLSIAQSMPWMINISAHGPKNTTSQVAMLRARTAATRVPLDMAASRKIRFHHLAQNGAMSKPAKLTFQGSLHRGGGREALVVMGSGRGAHAGHAANAGRTVREPIQRTFGGQEAGEN